MNNSPTSIRLVFPRGELEAPKLLKAAAKALSELERNELLNARLSAKVVSGFVGYIVQMAERVTDIPLADVLIGAWQTERRFAKYHDLEKFPPGSISVVPLATHRITSTHKPYVEISVAGKSLGRIPFVIELQITVESLDVVIQDARFMRIEAGRARVSGSLKCADQIILEKSSKDFAWDDGISLGAGVPIPTSAKKPVPAA
jgi:hypothetical protein